MENAPFSWERFREGLRKGLGAEVVERWIDPLRLESATERSVVLEAPNPFFRDWVTAHYLDSLKAGIGDRELRIVSSTKTPTDLAPLESPATPTSPGDHALNSKFTFDRFVVGPSNRFAHAASLAVAESPAKAYNPLFIYGGVGLGKTHLMQAIGHAIVARRANTRVSYVSSEAFTNELISAIQTKTTAKFRERYRTVDILLVDDIHFIAGKESTQEEFFHTFNTLYDAHKQIVISSDRSPKEIAGLEERLVSRFEWGLVTDIQPPDLETRIAILRKKAEEAGIVGEDAVTTFIAERITSNIRELEGALIRVVAYCRFFAQPLSVGVAQEVLKDMVREVGSRITVELVQRQVARYFGVEIEALRGMRRERSVLYPRQIAMYLSRKLTECSLPEIGRLFGGRDHTTVLHAVNKITRDIAQDGHKKSLVEHLRQLVVSASKQ